jgi:IS30 family transposase
MPKGKPWPSREFARAVRAARQRMQRGHIDQPHLTTDEVARIRELGHQGWKPDAIALEVRRGRSSVHRVLRGETPGVVRSRYERARIEAMRHGAG